MLSDRIPSKADIKLIRSLGQKKFREELGLFVVEGEKMVGEALTQKRFPVEAVYRLSDVGETVMGRMSHLSSPSPALAVLRIPALTPVDTAENLLIRNFPKASVSDWTPSATREMSGPSCVWPTGSG